VAISESKYQPNTRRSGWALCLSGGGFRAALFHLGALRRLNEVGLLSKMHMISSVSGGSVANGLLAKLWPQFTLSGDGSGAFKNFVDYETRLREFSSHDIRTGPLLTERLDPRNWPLLLGDDHSATDLLAQTYQDQLVGDLRLKDLAATRDAGGPSFVFNTSNLQTGVDFTFGPDGVHDWKLGSASAPDLLVAEAIAASSAFPVAFPPLVLKFAPDLFHGGDLESTRDPRAIDFRRRVVLSDGGVYDNLGLEPAWKHHEAVFSSDGGKPFDLDVNPAQALPVRLLRVQDVIGNQALAVRKRWLIASYEKGVYAGTYWGIGTEIEGYAVHGTGYGETVLDGLVLQRLGAVRTDFDGFTEDEQLVLMNHGWALADAALRTYMARALPVPVPLGTPPSAELLDHPERAAEALKDSARSLQLGRS
jgi:NTE family protein